MKTRKEKTITLIVSAIALLCVFAMRMAQKQTYSDSVSNIPEFSGQAYVAINNNEPEFSEEDITTNAYEFYSELDALGRCGYAMACIGTEIMPTEERGTIGQIKPSGWQTVKYDFIDGKYLYNRCHLIGFQLAGENANERNLITGTRFLNVEGMLPFENMIADYVKETDNHVIYRVTPIYDGDDLLARGVQMEAYSVEDNGEGICFHVYAYNNQPGIQIDYTTGNASLIESTGGVETSKNEEGLYVLNTNSKKFHRSDCTEAEKIQPDNRAEYSADRNELINQGYQGAKCCNP